MTADVLIAIDAGTGSGRAVAFGPDGHLLAMEQQEWTFPAAPGIPYGQSFDVDSKWNALCAAIRRVVDRVGASRVAAVSATSFREGFVLYGPHGQVNWACPNSDARAQAEALTLVESGLAERIYRTSGDWVSLTAPARLKWIADHDPEVLSGCTGIGMISDWIIHQLSGEMVTDPTCGSSSGLFDLAKRDWATWILDECRLSSSVVPPVLSPGTLVGRVTRQASLATGLPTSVAVVVGGADTQMGLLGLNAHHGEPFVLGGSFWQTATVTKYPTIDQSMRLRTLCHVADDEWMTEGIGFLTGLSLRWFRDAFCRDLIRDAQQAGNLTPFELMEREAAAVRPGAHGVIAILSNVMNAASWTHATPSFLQFDVANPTLSNRAACTRAIMEAGAYVVHEHLKLLAGVVGRLDRGLRFASGASAGTLWPQILADVTGKQVKTPDVAEATALGTAACAAVGIGLAESPEAFVGEPAVRTFEPSQSTHAQYQELVERWRSVYLAMEVVTVGEGLSPLWTAPGLSRGGHQSVAGSAAAMRNGEHHA